MLQLAMLMALLSCSGDQGDTPPEAPATAATAGPPKPAPTPPPMMRKAILCCHDIGLEPVLRDYLALGAALHDARAEAIAKAGAAFDKDLQSYLASVPDSPLAAIGDDASAIDPAQLKQARQHFGAISEAMLESIRSSDSGSLDVAVAYSRDWDHHWIQDGVEPRSPYGDTIRSYAWGTREEVRKSDQEREAALGHKH